MTQIEAKAVRLTDELDLLEEGVASEAQSSRSSAGGLAPVAETDLVAMDLPELARFVEGLGEPAYRAQQLFRWIHQRGARSLAAMTDLPKRLRERLEGVAAFPALVPHKIERAQDGTRKYAFRSERGDIVEAVFIPDASADGRNTLCISSQVGCALDCKFCLTASLGLRRNLSAGEIVEQLTRVKEDLRQNPRPGGREDDDHPIHNLVLMGMGEPLHNYKNLVKALHIFSDDAGHGISSRRITVSTVGLAPRIPELGRDTKVNLAISLNATTDEVRSRIMPINRRYDIATLLEACRAFPLPERRRITFEYVLLAGVNDTEADARRLTKLLRGFRCKVNLIPFNPHPYSPYERPSDEVVERFQRIVSDAGYSVFCRTARGDDISAACGQLGVEVEGPRRREALPVL